MFYTSPQKLFMIVCTYCIETRELDMLWLDVEVIC